MNNLAEDQRCIDVSPTFYEFSGHIFREDSYGIIKRLRFLLRQIEIARCCFGLNVSETKILDVGCGTGIAVTIPIAKCGYNIRGIDVDKASIIKAKSLTEKIPNITFSCHELAAFDSSENFHIVICSEVLEHLEKPGDLLKQIQSVLVENGLLLLTIPNGYGYFELESLIDERFPWIASFADNFQQRFIRKFGSETLKLRHSKERSREYCALASSSLDQETTHCNKFTVQTIKRLFEDNNYKIIDFKNRTFLAGNIVNVLLRESDSLLDWNGRVAEFLPNWMCSDWLIASVKPRSTSQGD